MSYDIDLCDPVDGSILKTDVKHDIRGGTYAMGGTQDMSLNVTYNYAKHFYRVMGEDGIRSIYGKTGLESIPILQNAIDQLGNDTDDNYWAPTEGNAKRALYGLLTFAKIRPDGVWRGD